MRKIFVMAVLLAASPVFAEDSGARLSYPNLGFSIKPLEDTYTGSNSIVMSMYLASSEKFAPNVNICVQDYRGSIEDYKKLSDKQFEESNISVLTSVVKENVFTLEYSGIMSGRDLHFYAVAVKKANQIYLVTAAATVEQWKKYSEKLIDTVRSFQLK
jgi:hypothetical protein